MSRHDHPAIGCRLSLEMSDQSEALHGGAWALQPADSQSMPGGEKSVEEIKMAFFYSD